MIYVNGEPVEFGQYPNGETVVPKLDVGRTASVRLHWEDDGDLVKLALVKGLLDQENIGVDLLIDYMPYSRMDREQDGYCFSLKYVATQISIMDWARIRIVEPHSDATLQLFHDIRFDERVEPIWATATLTPRAMEDMGFDKQRDYLVLPDKGAHDRYAAQMRELFDECNVITLRKRRDFKTGKILGLEVASRKFHGFGSLAAEAEGSKALIIDDLSSRGGTFVQAYRILRHGPLRCSSVSLLVTHMEEVGFTGELGTYLDKVYCTDTMHWRDYLLKPANFHVFKREDWLTD